MATTMDLALREVARYRGDMRALRLLPPTHLIGAVEALPVIDQFAGDLSARGALYDLDGDMYFARGLRLALRGAVRAGTAPRPTGSSR